MTDLVISQTNDEPSLYADIKALAAIGHDHGNEVTITVEPNRLTIKGDPRPAAQTVTELVWNGLKVLG